MITKEQFEALDKFSQYSSWTLWKDWDGVHPKSNISDLSIFENIDLTLLNNKYIFVGLNAAEHDREVKRWSAFHSEDSKRSQDYKLRHTLKGTKFEGSYITDFIKGLPLTDSRELLLKLKEDHSLVEKGTRDFLEELKILGNPVIITFGGATYNLVKKYLIGDYRVIKVPHYSSYISREEYKDIVNNILSELN